MDAVVEIVNTATVVEVVSSPAAVVEVAVAVGPPGPQGPAGTGGLVHAQMVPLGTWTIPHSLGRVPAVTLYDDLGELVDSDVTASAASVTVTYPSPRTGRAVLT